MKQRTPFWQTPPQQQQEKKMPKFSEITVTSAGRVKTPVNLEEYVSLLSAQEKGKNITLPLEDHEKPRVIMQFLNSAASQLGYKLFRVANSSNETEITFRIVNERGPNKRTTSSEATTAKRTRTR